MLLGDSDVEEDFRSTSLHFYMQDTYLRQCLWVRLIFSFCTQSYQVPFAIRFYFLTVSQKWGPFLRAFSDKFCILYILAQRIICKVSEFMLLLVLGELPLPDPFRCCGWLPCPFYLKCVYKNIFWPCRGTVTFILVTDGVNKVNNPKLNTP